MKTASSRFVLAAEILIIILFHVVKIQQSEKGPDNIVFTPVNKSLPIPKIGNENKSRFEYMFVNLLK